MEKAAAWEGAASESDSKSTIHASKSSHKLSKHLDEHRRSLIGDVPVVNSSSDADADVSPASKFWKTCLQTLPGFVFVVAYPTYVIPLFRSRSFSDMGRISVACVVHPLLLEMR